MASSAHQVGGKLRHDFVTNSATAVPVVIPDSARPAAAEIPR
jgi:RND superfamily putative drug exporter